jgi:hypothetical protein
VTLSAAIADFWLNGGNPAMTQRIEARAERRGVDFNEPSNGYDLHAERERSKPWRRRPNPID